MTQYPILVPTRQITWSTTSSISWFSFRLVASRSWVLVSSKNAPTSIVFYMKIKLTWSKSTRILSTLKSYLKPSKKGSKSARNYLSIHRELALSKKVMDHPATPALFRRFSTFQPSKKLRLNSNRMALKAPICTSSPTSAALVAWLRLTHAIRRSFHFSLHRSSTKIKTIKSRHNNKTQKIQMLKKSKRDSQYCRNCKEKDFSISKMYLKRDLPPRLSKIDIRSLARSLWRPTRPTPN